MQTFFDDSTFTYTVTIQELINLCQSNGGTALTATASQAVQCGLISDASKLGDLLNFYLCPLKRLFKNTFSNF